MNTHESIIAELLKRMVKHMGVSSICDLLTPDLLKLKDNEGDTLVHLAATIACFDELGLFLTPDMLMIQNDGGRTPFHMIRHPEHIEPIKDLLTPEALVVKDDQGETPIHFAVYFGFLGQISPLLTKDMLSIENKDGETPFLRQNGSVTMTNLKKPIPHVHVNRPDNRDCCVFSRNNR